jgi:O-antigen/teichoic acid export membrane protein
MTVNTASMVASSLLTGVLGLFFWGAAGRLYPAREVGVAAALITSGIMLSTMSILSIDSIFERFLPVAGARAGVLIKQGVLVVAVTSLLSGAGLVLFGPRDALFGSTWGMISYPFFVMVLAVFSLQDKASVGLGVARWAAGKNAFHAVAKLAVLFFLARSGSGVSIVLAWGVTAAVAVVVLLLAMRHRYRSADRFQGEPNLPPTRALWSYFGSSFGITASWAVAPLVVPLIIVARFGAEANAHFAVTWAVVNALYFAVALVVSPFVAEVAANPDEIGTLSVRMVQLMTLVTVVGSIGLVTLGPTVLGLVGGDYRTEGEGLLYLAAAFIPLAAIGSVYEGFARVRRKLKLMFVVRIIATVVIVVGSMYAVGELGVVGVGWAYLVAEAASAIVLLPGVVIWFRQARRGTLELSPEPEI